MTSTQTADIIRLDVRQTIASGGEPLEDILAAADQVAEGGTLELLAPFEPVPLYPVLRLRGFVNRDHPLEDGDHLVTFRQTGITADRTLADVAAQHPAVAPVMARHGFDMCCGGAKAIEVAAKAHGVELDALLAELQGALSQ